AEQSPRIDGLIPRGSIRRGGLSAFSSRDQGLRGLDQRVIAAGKRKKSRPEVLGLRCAVPLRANYENRQLRVQVMRPKGKVQSVVIAKPHLGRQQIGGPRAQRLQRVVDRPPRDGVVARSRRE